MIKLNKLNSSQRLFTYKVAHDGGSAPNPFYGVCTLAICKPAIRRVAKKGDVILGLGCGQEENRIVYCMRVDESILWEDYIKRCNAGALSGKVPKNSKDQGDCIWKDANSYDFVLTSWSMHEGKDDYSRDVINGRNVLLGEEYWYFGKGNFYDISLPFSLNKIIPGRGHRSNSNNEFKHDFIDFFNNMLEEKDIPSLGKLGNPAIEPQTASKEQCLGCRNRAREFSGYEEE